jgi:general secretion pathway protein G
MTIPRRAAQRQRAFTLVEMLVVCAMLSILALAVMPMAEIAQQRWKERELRDALREIRAAIDGYKAQHDAAMQGRPSTGSGYPPSLQDLLAGFAAPGSAAARPLLRRLPRDPFADDGMPAELSWGLRAYDSPAHAPRAGADVYDVFSLSTWMGSNGIELARW